MPAGGGQGPGAGGSTDVQERFTEKAQVWPGGRVWGHSTFLGPSKERGMWQSLESD